MTARETLDGIRARESRRQDMIEDGSYRVTQTRCNDLERHGFNASHPENVRQETSHHHSYISHLEALADHVPRLSNAVEAVLALADEITADSRGRGLDLAEDDFDRGWYGARREVVDRLRAAIENALKEGQ